MNEKRYVVRKYIYAKDIQDVLKKEKSIKPDDIWIDDDWKKLQDDVIKNIGLNK